MAYAAGSGFHRRRIWPRVLTVLLSLGVLTAGAAIAARAANQPTVLITGSSRGIGLELARQYAERGWQVIATCRTPAKAADLQAIAADHDNLVVERLDVTDFEEVDALAAKYAERPIDVLLNNAGISGGSENQEFGNYQFEVYYQVHAVNVVGPLKMAEAFIEHVRASEQKKIINITSTQGSIARNFGGNVFYRSSKSALNMAMNTLAIELKKEGITVGLVSPGFVKTDFTRGLDLPIMITPEESAASVISVIDDYGFEKTGMFIRHTNEEAPW
jgi:NAD(P)-dependent dehydrogenase (short-subunit alcohol dehydrogenase family)